MGGAKQVMLNTDLASPFEKGGEKLNIITCLILPRSYAVE
jgi:hypothetical protein